MASYLFQDLVNRAKSALGITNKDIYAAKEWFRAQAQKLTGVSAAQMMASDKARFLKTTTIGEASIGKMLLFFYDPKTKEQLPYYDRFPLIFPIESYKDGFLGINMHYLSPFQRAKLMDALYSVAQSPKTPQQKLSVTYGLLKGASKFKLFKPCVKRYLYTHVRSRFFDVRPEEWDTVLVLPVERFESGGAKGGTVGGPVSKRRVWAESMRMIK